MLDTTIYCPFISQLNHKEQLNWVEQLNLHFASISTSNNVKVVIGNQLSLEQKQSCKFAIVANPVPTDLAEYPNLVWIQSLWAGVEKLVMKLSNYSFEIVRLVDPMLSKIMSEAVLAWSLYLHRQMPEYMAQQKNNCWKQLPHVLPQERTICILGLGALGTECAKALVHHGFNVVGWSNSVKTLENVQSYSGDEGIYDAVKNADIVVCLLPLTAKTNKLLNRDFFIRMKQGASIINFARGGIVNHEDLIEALDRGFIRHAVLDVFDNEPLPQDSELWQHNKLTIIPHISAPTYMPTAVSIVTNNITHFIDTGEIPKSINKKSGY